MIQAVALLAFALALAVVPVLPGAAMSRWPRIGLTLCFAALGSLLTAGVGAGLLLALPAVRRAGGLPELVHRCPTFLGALLDQPWTLGLAVIGVIASLVVSGRVAWAVGSHTRRLARDSRAYRQWLAVATSPGKPGWRVLPEDRSIAWSVAGGVRAEGVVVVSSGALDALDDVSLQVVLAHEQAHLQGRHHLLVALSQALAAALPCPMTGQCSRAVASLVEMRADDIAARGRDRASVARALLRLSATEHPAPALGAGGSASAIAARVARLTCEQTTARFGRAVLAARSVGLLMVPLWLLVTAIHGALVHFCPLPA